MAKWSAEIRATNNRYFGKATDAAGHSVEAVDEDKAKAKAALEAKVVELAAKLAESESYEIDDGQP